MEEVIMSEKEWDRYKTLQQVVDGKLTQKAAACLLGITDRQVRNLLQQVVLQGTRGVISKRRGKPSNRKKSQSFKEKALSVLRGKLEGFGPTLAQEKLLEMAQLAVSRETLRQWMIQEHLWMPRTSKKRIHLPRARRACFGELIQADGSHHRWFGEDGPEVNLNVFIDDATGNITSLVFSEAETLNSYFVALEQHLKRYGRPRALYTDRFSVFKVPQGHGITQMHQALKKLDIELILANSPQAKGRVERANRTLQDRLVKEMHLKGIKSIVEANEFAQEFLELYNDKFSKKPVSDVDAHRSLDGYDLNRILCRYENRTLLSGLIFQFNNQFFKVQESPKIKCGKGSKVEIRMTADHKMRVFFKEHELQVTPLNEVAMPLVLSSKEVMTWKSLPKHKPSKFHPWRHRQCFWHTIDHNK